MKEILQSRLFIGVILGIIILIGFLQFTQDPDKHPCAPQQYPGRCYRITRDVCETSWNKFAEECTAKVKGLSLSPTRLLGPIEFNCQTSKLDRAFEYLRVTNSDCDEQQEKLEKWRKTNPDF